MKTPEWLKPGLHGAVAGAVALAIIGFSWGGWVTESTAKKIATDRARDEVLAVLTPICVEQSKQDPRLAEKLVQLKGAASYNRGEMVMKTGWATMPGTKDPNRDVASACVEKLGIPS